MYRCHIDFYFIGCQRRISEQIKGISPLEYFSHEFFESTQPEEALASRADLILADVQALETQEGLDRLIQMKPQKAQLILLAKEDPFRFLDIQLSDIKDVWMLPMSDAELRFRFQRWQQEYKGEKDFWQASHFLEATIDNIPSLIWYKDKKGIHEKVNKSFCKTVNKTREQVEGQGHAYIWDVEEDDPACIESEEEVMRLEKTCISEETIKTGEGEKNLTVYKSPLYDLDGSVMGTVGVAIDVTQERVYKQEIIKKSHALETIFTTMDCGVMCHTLDGSRILSVNRAALKILGYESQEELLADGFHLVAASILKEDRERIQERIRTLKKEGDNVSVEYRVRHKNGEILHITGNVKLIKKNETLFYQRFLLDCTAQKLQEEKDRRHQLELIHALSIDYNLVCFFDLDTDTGTAIQMDDSYSGLFGSVFFGGLSLKESMGFYIEKFVFEEDKERMLESLSLERLKRELIENLTYYVSYRAYVGEEVNYFQVKVVRTGEWEERHSVVLGIRNVDEETRREMKKKELLEDALAQANRASKAKSVFLSNMSHDIRTPMNAIVGFTSLAITHIDRKEHVEEYLKKIQTSGNHLLSLINDVLDMSRIESGKITLDEQPCSLPDILHGLRSIVQADIRAKQQELYIDTVDVLDEDIYCDRLRLNQVLLNLIGNAIKYTGAGGIVSVRITEKAGAPEGYANYEFCIKDTGIGMSQEFVEHIFEPFERERTSTVSGIQGTGLGMAITKNIVDMMNGSIEVKSQQNVGTEVTVAFTFRCNIGTKEIPDIPELKGCRALVVDDDFNACDSVSYMLQQIGLRAEWTLSGKEAVLRTRQAVMRKNAYHVYIVDWLLPDMNGVEVVRRIRKETKTDVPIIILTAYDWSEIEQEAKEAGVSAFCSKPLFLSELQRCLKYVVNGGEKQEKKGKKEQEKLRSGRILLAEDNELNQEIATAILEEAGFLVEVAKDGQTAVDMVKNSEPDYYRVVLMDVQMPVMGGYEATRTIRGLEDKKQASIPIVAMTANAFDEDRREALQCGMDGHITKPIDMKNLFDTLDEILA